MGATETDQLAWMRDQLSRYSYRPGWIMRFDDSDPPMLVVEYDALDSRNPDVSRRFTTHSRLLPEHCRDEDTFTAAIVNTVEELELHESREWLRRDGVLVADPHQDPSRWHCSCGTLGPVRRPDNTPWTCSGCGTTAKKPEEN